MAGKTKTFWKLAELAKFLGIQRSSIRYYLEKGAPKRNSDNKFDVEAFCRFLVTMPVKGSQKSPAREQAYKFLVNKGIDVKPYEKPKKPIPAPTPPPKPKKRAKKHPITTLNEKTVLGMVAALQRARQAEYDAHEIYQKGFKKTGIISAVSLDIWQKTLDILRRCETDFIKTMERQRLLVERSAVQTYIETMIEQVKQTMLNLPSKMAPSLDGLPWQEIQEKMEAEVRDVLEGLSNYE